MGNQPALTETYQQHGVKFFYPADWTLEEQTSAEEIQVLVQSPESAFWVLNLYFERPDLDELIQSAVETYRNEYQEIDIDQSEQTVGDHLSLAVDIEFLCLDLPNTAFIRTFVTDRFTVLILAQYPGGETGTEAILHQMTQSLRCEEDLLGFEEL
ncbi:MAG: hypothetical protein KDA65_10325 [Planctomycetaceae bacterium]|nr:hypothetical protein [Planctomycetaceae bacterium]